VSLPKCVTIAGVDYLLDHLANSVRVMRIPANSRMPERAVSLAISYGLHCFTRAAELGERENVSDGRERRVFAVDRYDLSHQLPGILDSLESRKCFHTAYSNFFTVEYVNQSGVKQDYVVYFRTWRSGTKDAGDVRVHVESAYLRSDAPKWKKPIRFKVIVANTFTKKPIVEPGN